MVGRASVAVVLDRGFLAMALDPGLLAVAADGETGLGRGDVARAGLGLVRGDGLARRRICQHGELDGRRLGFLGDVVGRGGARAGSVPAQESAQESAGCPRRSVARGGRGEARELAADTLSLLFFFPFGGCLALSSFAGPKDEATESAQTKAG